MKRTTIKNKLSKIGVVFLALLLVFGSLPFNLIGAGQVFADDDAYEVNDDPVANTFHIKSKITGVTYMIEVEHQNGTKEMVDITTVQPTDIIPKNANLRITYNWQMPVTMSNTSGTAISIQTLTGSAVAVTYDGQTNNYNHIVADDLVVNLTDQFDFPTADNQQPSGLLGQYGYFAGENGEKVTLHFNDSFMTKKNIHGTFVLDYTINSDTDIHSVIEEIELPFADGTTQTVTLNFEGPTGSAITKKASKVDDDNFNWEIDINTNLAKVAKADAVLVDTYDAKLDLSADDVHVYKLTVMTDGTLVEGDEITTGFVKTVDNDLKQLVIAFDDAIDATAYRIKYQTTVNNADLTVDSAAINNNNVSFTFKNNAVFPVGGTPVSREINIDKGKLIEKTADNVDYNANQITWHIKFNEAGLSLTDPVLVDTLPAGLVSFNAEDDVAFTVVPNTVNFTPQNTADGFKIQINGSLNEAVEFTYTTEIDKSEGSLFYDDTTGSLDFKNEVVYLYDPLTKFKSDENVTVDKGTRLTKIGDLVTNYTDNEKYVEWQVFINRDEVDLGKVVYEDFITGANHELIVGSVEISKVTPTGDNSYDNATDVTADHTIRYAQAGGDQYDGSNKDATKPLATLTGQDTPPIKYFDVEFNQPVTGTYLIKYKTKVTGLGNGGSTTLELDNYGEIWHKPWVDGSNGWGSTTDWNVKKVDRPFAQTITNSFKKYTYNLAVQRDNNGVATGFAGSVLDSHNIDYSDNNSMDWVIEIKPLNNQINTPTVKDNFTEGLYIPIPEGSNASAELAKHIYVTKGNSSSTGASFANSTVLASGYTLTPLLNASNDKIVGFEVAFTIDLKNKNYYVAYTNYLDPDVTTQGLSYDNTATLHQGATQIGNAHAAPVLKPIDQTEGDKVGSPVALQPDQREMTWTVRVNHLAKNISGPNYDDSYLNSEYDYFNTIVDQIQGYQKIVDGSVKIYTYDLAADGSEINLSEVTNQTVGTDDNSVASASYEIVKAPVMVNGVTKEVETLIVKLAKTISRRYKVVYKTERYGISQYKYQNTALFNNDRSYQAEITYTKGQTHVHKGSNGSGNVAGRLYADWQIDINESKSDVTELLLTDTVSVGAEIDPTTIVLKKDGTNVNFTDYFALIGPELYQDNNGDLWNKYTFEMTNSDPDFVLQDHLVLTYRTWINVAQLLDDTVTNNIELAGKYKDYQVTQTETGGSVTFNSASGSGSGQKSGFILTKTDSVDGSKLPGVEFLLEVKDDNGNYGPYLNLGNQGVLTTNASGQIAELKLPYGDYRITEKTPKDNYQLGSGSTDFTTNTTQKYHTLNLTNDRIRKIVVTKQDVDTDDYLADFTFELYKIQHNSNLFVAKGVTGGDDNSDGVISASENKIVFDRFTDLNGGPLQNVRYLEPGRYKLIESYTSATKPYQVHQISEFDLTDTDLTYDSGFTKTVEVKNEKARKLQVIKHSDADTLVDPNQGLIGATYIVEQVTNVVRDANGNITSGTPVAGTVQTLVTDKDGNSTTLASVEKGNVYRIHETVAPQGHEIDATPRYVEIDANSSFITTVHFINKSQRLLVFKKLGVHKLNGGAATAMLSGAQFKLEKKDDNGTYQLYGTYSSNSDAQNEVVLTAGAYKLTEIAAPSGYKLSAKVLDAQDNAVSNSTSVEFEFTTNNSTTTPIAEYQFSFINELERKIQITKKDIDSKTDVKKAGIQFEIYEANADITNDVPVDTVTTDINGVATSKVLPKGDYKVVETVAPTGYFGSDLQLSVSITDDDPALVKIDFENERQRSIKIIKLDDRSTTFNQITLKGAKFDVYTSQDLAPNSKINTQPLVTNDDGYVILSELVKGTYYVVETEAPQFYHLSSTPQIIVIDKDSATVVDVKIENAPKTYKLGDYVWYDTNKDGIQNDGLDSGVAGVTVTLTKSDGTTETTTTDADGKYQFTDLPNGDYKVVFSNLPTDYEETLTGQGSDHALDSNGLTTTLTIAGADNMTIDLGIKQKVVIPPTPSTYKLGDYVWYDTDVNGLQDTGETGVKDVIAALYKKDTSGNYLATGATTTTDSNGYYEFTGLTNGEYQVVFSNLPPSYVPTTTGVGTDDAKDSDGLSPTGEIKDADNMTLDLGIYSGAVLPVKPYKLGDYVWYDTDKDGLQDIGEAGVKDVIATLYKMDTSGNYLATGATTTTDSNGYYEFTGLTNGEYQVVFSNLPPSYIPTKTGVGTDDAKDSDGLSPTGQIKDADNMTLDLGIVKNSTTLPSETTTKTQKETATETTTASTETATETTTAPTETASETTTVPTETASETTAVSTEVSTLPTTTEPTYISGNTPDPNRAESPEVIVVIDENGTPLGTYRKKVAPNGDFIYVDDNGVPLGTTKVVKTGNDFPEVIFMMIAVLSLIGAFVLRRAIKKATY